MFPPFSPPYPMPNCTQTKFWSNQKPNRQSPDETPPLDIPQSDIEHLLPACVLEEIYADEYNKARWLREQQLSNRSIAMNHPVAIQTRLSSGMVRRQTVPSRLQPGTASIIWPKSSTSSPSTPDTINTAILYDTPNSSNASAISLTPSSTGSNISLFSESPRTLLSVLTATPPATATADPSPSFDGPSKPLSGTSSVPCKSAAATAGSKQNRNNTPSNSGKNRPRAKSVDFGGLPGPDREYRKMNLFKTEMCRSFEETGQCKYGDLCHFAHSADELRPVKRHPRYKSEVCKTFWEKGSCPYGKRCCFIHHHRESGKLPKGSIIVDHHGNISPEYSGDGEDDGDVYDNEDEVDAAISITANGEQPATSESRLLRLLEKHAG